VGGLFELADLGALGRKGFPEPVRAWRVLGEGRAEGRFEALRGERLTPLVGCTSRRGWLSATSVGASRWPALVGRRRKSPSFAAACPTCTASVPICSTPSGSAFWPKPICRRPSSTRRAALDRAIETAAATGECYYQAELYRLRGVVVAKTGEAAEAGV
jgi:hypothetical protein